MIGGKTGTAETLPRGNKEYVVSFMGYAPADNPEIAIYVVVDRPNVPGNIMDDAKFATKIVRNVLTEVLPYMGIFMTEELSEDERKELEALQIEIMTPVAPEAEEGDSPEGTPEGMPEEGAEGGNGESGEGGQNGGGQGENPEGTGTEGEGEPYREVWKDFPIDPVTGYAIDPDTGNYVDPVTGAVLGGSYESGVQSPSSPDPDAAGSASPSP